MALAPAAIIKITLTPSRNTTQIIIASTAVVGLKDLHNLTPFIAMGADVRQAVETITNIMSHFMGHGSREIIAEVLSKNMGIKTHHSFIAPNPIHATATTAQVKQHGNGRKLPTVLSLSQRQCCLSFIEHLRLLLSINRLDERCRQGCHLSSKPASENSTLRELAHFKVAAFYFALPQTLIGNTRRLTRHGHIGTEVKNIDFADILARQSAVTR